ncbi:fructosamine kinase family protein [Ascidiimonas sp. W6]|uniref:fructosamine kinase family protein n=1 Tax=Ascidiimonas meishanensis TaxID=3128903 RepID=UPI0030EC98DD
MLAKTLNTKISQSIDEDIKETSLLTGGDINKVYKIQTFGKKTYVLKLNDHSNSLKIFESEKEGLLTLGNTKTFKTPKIISLGRDKETSFLLMEYIEEGTEYPSHDEEFGRNLATLHQVTQNAFGFKQNNFIGNLPQYNEARLTASSFYIEMRLEPQLRMAAEQGFKLKVEKPFSNISDIIPKEPPALVHGDLWQGNTITASNGFIYIIDPAVHYGHRETDIAMMLLFGGFSMQLFESYHELYPLTHSWKDRLDIWQLYYLLVHLNLFGSSYYARVKQIIDKYK